MKKYIFILIFLLTISYVPYAIAQVKLETGLPNVPSGEIPIGQNMLAKYINYLFIFGLGLIAFLALGQMIFGGILYILAASNAVKVEDAKDHIKQALIGLGFILISYLFLRTINPDLVNLKNPSIVPQSFQFKAEPGTRGEVLGPIYKDLGKSCKLGDPLPFIGAVCSDGTWVDVGPLSR